MQGTDDPLGIAERLAAIPDEPGVYLFRGRRREILYVGKAKRLRRRIRSYFRPGADHPPRIRVVLARVWRVEALVVGDEHQALVLEAALIRAHRPRYNQRLRATRGYPYLRVAPEADAPILLRSRVADDGAAYFGPCPLPGQLISGLRAIRRLYLERDDLLAGDRGERAIAARRTMASDLLAMLEGRSEALTQRTRSAVAAAAAGLDFERAGRLQRGLEVLEGMRGGRSVASESERLPVVLDRVAVDLSRAEAAFDVS